MKKKDDVKNLYPYDSDGGKAARQAAELIGRAFVWEATKEGPIFWSDLQDRLYEIAEKILKEERKAKKR
jgi:hypothetical protein